MTEVVTRPALNYQCQIWDGRGLACQNRGSPPPSFLAAQTGAQQPPPPLPPPQVPLLLAATAVAALPAAPTAAVVNAGGSSSNIDRSDINDAAAGRGASSGRSSAGATPSNSTSMGDSTTGRPSASDSVRADIDGGGSRPPTDDAVAAVLTELPSALLPSHPPLSPHVSGFVREREELAT